MPSAPLDRLVLHASRDVHAPRQLASWALLAGAAGAVNAGALMACGRFVTHVTGTLTHTGLDAGSGAWWLVVDYVLVVLAFIAGAMASVLPLQARARRGLRPLHATALGTVGLVLAAAAFAGHFDVFGVVGGDAEEVSDFALMCVLAFAMGLMNATVSTSTALAVRTTHMTGPATDFAVHLATAWLSAGDERREAMRAAVLRGSKIVAFAVGAAVMVPTVAALGHLAFLLPATMIAIATIRSFLPAQSIARRASRSEKGPSHELTLP